MITEPMKAATLKRLDDPKLKFPLIATPKLNGWRCLKVNGKVLTKAFKPFPNHHIRKTLEKILPDGIDGEVICGTYNETQSACATREGEPDFEFHAFDYVKFTTRGNPLTLNYACRLDNLRSVLWAINDKRLVRLPHDRIESEKDLSRYENEIVGELGHEGICLRTPDSPYKCGRSTMREQYLMKYKRFEDSEGEVVGFVEKMTNENDATTDAFGRTKRSHSKLGKIASGELGALVIRDEKHGWEFELGTGFTEKQRREFWANRNKLKGKLAKYKFNKHGMKDKPLNASFQGWRSKVDM